MTKQEIAARAEELGFITAWISPEKIPVDAFYLQFCEENRCGNYNANYACPPDCGTPEQMHGKLLSADLALVLQSQWEVSDYASPEVLTSKKEHSASIRRLLTALRGEGLDVFAVGYGGCNLCSPCKRITDEPCAFPDLRMSCMSAYCVDVGKLAERCQMPFEWDPRKLHLFGMILFRGLKPTERT